MKFTFLGTGTSQGVPVIGCNCDVCQSTDSRDRRLRTAALLEAGGKTIVIDTGPDFRLQMLQAGAKYLDAVLFTHPHKDHLAGLDDIRPFYFRQQKPLSIYANEITQEALKREYSYFFAEKRYPGVPEVQLANIDKEPFKIGKVKIIPIPGLHYKMPVLGFRIGPLAYITDINFLPDSSLELLRGVKVLALNALRMQKHISHYNLSEAIALIEQLEPEQAYLTHLSHLMGLHEEVSAILPENIFFAWDGLQLEI